MIIDIPTAKQMTALHEDRRQHINSTLGINDTKAMFFPIESVRAFMDQLPAHASGVRIYLGVYPHDHPKYANQTTIVAIGTVDDGTGKHIDNMQGIASPHAGGGGGNPANHSDLCPPDNGC